MKAEVLHQITLVFFVLNVIFALLLFYKKVFLRYIALILPIGVLGFLAILWVSYGRPPFKTLGETRLWYAALLPLLSFVFAVRFKIYWLMQFAIGMAAIFLLINVIHPEVYDKTLAPALQSYWFVPHVVVYIASYALLAAGFLIALREAWQLKKGVEVYSSHLLRMDDILRIGFCFLSAGLVFGAFWAKEAWGHYWTWDPKETWAFITWGFFLFYFHFRFWYPTKKVGAVFMVLTSFLVLLVCWFGLNYMAIGQTSVHTYSN